MDKAAGRKRRLTGILGIVAAIVYALGIGFSLVQHGTFDRIWHDLVVRPSGPFGGRFILQPVVATIVAFVAGVADARAGRQPYFWRVAHDKEGRWDHLVEAAGALANVLFMAVILDTLYQLVVLRTFHWFETILVAILLAFVPYLIVRDPAARLAGLFVEKEQTRQEKAQ